MTSMVLTLLMLLLLFVNPSTAFTSLQQPHSIIKEPRKRRPANIFQRHATTSITSPEKSYGETSRKFRRTFFTHKDWLRHREDDRLVRRIIGIFKSGIVRQLAKDVGYVVAMATVVVVWNCLLGVGFTNISGLRHGPLLKGFPTLKLPMEPFTLSSPALSLLLGE